MNFASTPLVSVIIPTYNHANFLGKALESVINQTYSNWEAIVIDNQSTDQTNQVIGRFRDSRIKYYKIFNNGIIAKSRNLGIDVAKGEWIAFLDSDDWWIKEKLEICFKNINQKVDFIYHDLEIIYDKKKNFLNRKKIVGRQLYKPILNDLLIGEIEKGNAIGNSSVIVRKEMLNKIGGISEEENLVASEDFNTWLKIAKITNEFKYIKRKLGFYLVHENSAQRRDLSIPHRHAVTEFMQILNNKQKLDLEVKLKYMSGSYNFLNKKYTKAKKDFIFVIKYGGINLKLRSLLKTIIIILKKNEKTK